LPFITELKPFATTAGCGVRQGCVDVNDALPSPLPLHHALLTVKDVLAERLEGLVRGAEHGEGAVAAERGRSTWFRILSPRDKLSGVWRSHVTRAKASHACAARPAQAPPVDIKLVLTRRASG